MALKKYNYCRSIAYFFISILIISNFQNVYGLRILEGEEWLKKNTELIIQSLRRGSVPSKGANPCTNIPGGKKKGRCMLAQNEGKVIIASQIDNNNEEIAPFAYPGINMVRFGTANSENNNTQKQESNHS